MARHAGALLALALAACAQPPPVPQAPPGIADLGLDGPVEPIVAPVTLARGSLGRFGQTCSEFDITAAVQGHRSAQTVRSCGTLSVSQAGPGWERIAIAMTEGPAAGATIALERSAAGEFRGLSASGGPVERASALERQRIEETLAMMSRLLALAPPGRYLAGHVFEATERVPGQDVTITVRCTLAGRSRLGGREVAVVTCDGTSPYSTRDPASGVAMTGSISQNAVAAVDTETTATRRSAALTRLWGSATGRPGTSPVPMAVTVNARGRLD